MKGLGFVGLDDNDEHFDIKILHIWRVTGGCEKCHNVQLVTRKCHFVFMNSLRCTPLVVVTSCLEEKKKKTLKSQIHKLGM